MRDAGQFIDGIDLHFYTITGTWRNKGKATEFTEAEWFEMVNYTKRMEEFITRHSAIMDQYDPQKRVWLIVGEWGTWHTVEEGTNPGFLYQQNALRDAVVAGYNLNLFNNHADRVKGANIAQTINVLQAMILTKGEQMILTPTYHVFEMYKVHQDATLLPINLEEGTYTYGGESTGAVSASASRDSQGRIHITLVNMDPEPGPYYRGRTARRQCVPRLRTRADGQRHDRPQHFRAAGGGETRYLQRRAAERWLTDNRSAGEVGCRAGIAVSKSKRCCAGLDSARGFPRLALRRPR